MLYVTLNRGAEILLLFCGILVCLAKNMAIKGFTDTEMGAIYKDSSLLNMTYYFQK